MVPNRLNPFTPGAGELPPHRAGHKSAVRELSERVDRIVAKSPGGMVVLHGPRGNGKTVLLAEVRRQAVDRNAAVRWLTPDDWSGTTESFAERLPAGLATKPELRASFSVDLGVVKASINYRSGSPDLLATAVLQKLAEAGPVVLLADEAHNLPPATGQILLNAGQRCISDGLPLLLVLAGTPGIRQSLKEVDASFWERAHRLRVGRLETPDIVRAALSIPARNSGLPFAEDALELLVGESQRYPFFVQLLAKASWNVAQEEGHDHITLADALEGVEIANEQRHDFYEDRRVEIVDGGLHREGLAVSRAMAERGADPSIPARELDGILETVVSSDPRAIERAKGRLSSLGLIWERAGGVWEPGIPSLCKFVADYYSGE